MGVLRNVITAAAMLATVAGVSQAQTYTVGTQGCFLSDPTCPANGGWKTTGATNGPYGGLEFDGGTYTANSSGSIFLGYVYVNNPDLTFNQPFELMTTFSSPTGVSPNSPVFESFVSGILVGHSIDTYSLTFNNTTPQTFTSDDGTFEFNVLNPNGLASTGNIRTGTPGYFELYGQITSTPEPSSMALLGTGLIGLVPMIRRRRK